MKRLVWLDIAKGLAILVVAYFHFFTTYFENGALPPNDWSSIGSATLSILGSSWLFVSGLGFHAVGVFIILSGFALMESTLRRAEKAPVGWASWYGARFVRLYPMYWVAHLVYLLSPFVARLEPVDNRIWISLSGLRFINIEMNFMYLNAAWWYFAMLIQFYVLFPLLFLCARKLGPLTFLVIALAAGFFVRYLLLLPFAQNGLWVLGGCALCRLPEFALGMALGMWHRRGPERLEKFLLGGAGLISGIILYPAALQLYHNGFTYVFVDLATGGCCFLVIVGIAGILARFAKLAAVFAFVGAFSYGLYLVHQPYMIWLGLRIRELPIWLFLLVCIPVLAALTGWGFALEKSINALVTKLMPSKAKA